MKPPSTFISHLKIDYSLPALWLATTALLSLMTSSLFIIVPLSLGTSLAFLYALQPTKWMKIFRYALLFALFFIEILIPSLKPLNLSLTAFFLPLFFYFDIEESNAKQNVFLISLFSFLFYLTKMSPTHLLFFISLCLLSMNEVFLILNNRKIRENYDNYYYLSNSEKKELESLYQKLSLEQDTRIENAILNERTRLSRDIHDSLGHLTSRGILQIGAMLVTEKDSKRKEALLNLKNTLSEGMNEVRRSLHGVQNEAIILREELQKIVDHFSFCEVSLTFSSTTDFPLKFKYSILFIVQEALTNISRHSSATKASLSFIETEEKIYLKITDNGKNADLSPNGMGLYSIKKRAEDLGGRAEFSVDKGFRIFITLEKFVPEI